MPPPDAAFDLVAAELETFRLPVIVVGRRAVGCGPAIEQLAERLGAPIITVARRQGHHRRVASQRARRARRLRLSGLRGDQAHPAAGRRHPRHRRRHHQAVPDRADRRPAPRADPVRIRVRLPDPRVPPRPHAGRAARGHLPTACATGSARVRAARCSPTSSPSGRRSSATSPASRRRERAADRCTRASFLLRLGEALPADAVVVFDTGVHTLWAAQYLRLTRRQRVMVCSHLGIMGFSLPAAIAAQLASPGEPRRRHLRRRGIPDGGGRARHRRAVRPAAHRRRLQQRRAAERAGPAAASPTGRSSPTPTSSRWPSAYGAEGVVVDAGADIPGILEAALQRPRQVPVGDRFACRPDAQVPAEPVAALRAATLRPQGRER